jgi:hypothetical protein
VGWGEARDKSWLRTRLFSSLKARGSESWMTEGTTAEAVREGVGSGDGEGYGKFEDDSEFAILPRKESKNHIGKPTEWTGDGVAVSPGSFHTDSRIINSFTHFLKTKTNE